MRLVKGKKGEGREKYILRTHYSNEITPDMDGEDVTIAGWIHEKRDLGGIIFIIIRDRNGFIQVTFHKDRNEALFEKVRKVAKETVVAIGGKVKKEEKAPNGLEIIPSSVDILSVASSPLPLDVTGRIRSELEKRLDSRFIDLRVERNREIFIMRSDVLRLIREFLYREGFIEINTPKIVSAATEGGTALFPISYFNKEAFLNQSPQLYKQIMMATGLDRVYEIAPIFRAEEHDTTKHLNEATSVDIEAAFVSYEYVMDLLEELISSVYEGLISLGYKVEPVETPFERITYTEAIDLLSECDLEEEVEWGDDLSAEAENALGKILERHYFIIEWPKKIKPYYAMPIEGKDVCKAFDLMHPRVELASGSQRVHSYELLKKNIEEKGLDPGDFEFYLNAFRYGMPPHAGWGLGVERLLMTILNVENIREVVLFPRDRRRVCP